MLKNDANIVKLLKEFIKYCHSDDALSYYTGTQGVYRKCMDYPVKEEHRNLLSAFQKSYLDAYASRTYTVEAVNYAGIFPTKSLDYATGTESWASYENGGLTTNRNAQAIFKGVWISDSVWNSSAYKAVWSKIY